MELRLLLHARLSELARKYHHNVYIYIYIYILCVFLIYFRFKVVPLCRLMQKICGFRLNFTYITSAMSSLSLSGFTSAILISVELASNCAQGDVAISSGDFDVLKNKRSNVEFASKGDLRRLIHCSPSLSHFHQNACTPTSLPVT